MGSRPFLLSTLAIGLFAVNGATAQTGTGVYGFGAYDSLGPDVINVGNLNIHFAIPILNKPGRKLALSYSLSYDGLIWVPVTTGGTTSWSLASGSGWRGATEAATGYVSYTSSSSTSGGCTTVTGSNYVYHDASGTTHAFPGFTTTHDSCTTPTASTAYPVDGSGYSITFSSSGISITDGYGDTLSPPLNATSGAASITDSNGNEITIDGSGHFTDTLGLVALTISGSSASSMSYTYTDTTATARSVTVTYGTYLVQTAFGCTGISDVWFCVDAVDQLDHLS